MARRVRPPLRPSTLVSWPAGRSRRRSSRDVPSKPLVADSRKEGSKQSRPVRSSNDQQSSGARGVRCRYQSHAISRTWGGTKSLSFLGLLFSGRGCVNLRHMFLTASSVIGQDGLGRRQLLTLSFCLSHPHRGPPSPRVSQAHATPAMLSWYKTVRDKAACVRVTSAHDVRIRT